MNDVLLRVEGLAVCFGRGARAAPVVDGVDFEVGRGETFALLGESGCGKSLTCLSIMGLLPDPGRVTAGTISLDGKDIARLPDSAMRRVRGRRIGMVFQDPMTSLNPVLTAGEQIVEAVREHRGLGLRAARAEARDLLASVGIADPDRRLGEYPHQLSGGMKQRVMIAIALAGEPDLLIADEPTTALDVTIQAQVLWLLKDLQRERGMAILLITHDLGVVAETADRLAVMYAGRIVEEARRAQFFDEPRHPYSRRLFAALPTIGKRRRRLAAIPGTVPPAGERAAGCRFADRCDVAWDACAVEPPMYAPVTGHHVRCHLYDAGEAPRRRGALAAVALETGRVPPPRVAAGALLEVEDLRVHFPVRRGGLSPHPAGPVRAVDGVSFAIGRGRTLALVGESGCGKTTVGKAILRLVAPSAGRILLDGEDFGSLSGEALRLRRRDLQMVFQDAYASMNPRMRVGDIIAEGMVTLGIESDARRREARVRELLGQVGLPAAAAGHWPHEFSGGQRQRICIARALAVAPRLIVCDEPTSALDVSVQAQILNLMQSLQDELGLSYLFITHNLPVVAWLADEVAVMYLGRLVEYGRTDEVLEAPRHPYTRALLAAVPRIDDAGGREVLRVGGDPPSPAAPPAGCHFHARCPEARPVCRELYPSARRFSDTHVAACHLYEAAEASRTAS